MKLSTSGSRDIKNIPLLISLGTKKYSYQTLLATLVVAWYKYFLALVRLVVEYFLYHSTHRLIILQCFGRLKEEQFGFPLLLSSWLFFFSFAFYVTESRMKVRTWQLVPPGHVDIFQLPNRFSSLITLCSPRAVCFIVSVVSATCQKNARGQMWIMRESATKTFKCLDFLLTHTKGGVFGSIHFVLLVVA